MCSVPSRPTVQSAGATCHSNAIGNGPSCIGRPP
jgi:hypothetical protein